MDVNITEVFEIRRGKKYIIIDDFKFSEFILNKDECNIFHCTDRNYKIITKITDNLKLVISINKEHNHKTLQKETVTKQKVTSVLKRKATTDLNARPNKLIKQELLNCTNLMCIYLHVRNLEKNIT